MQTNWKIDLVKTEEPFDRISDVICAETIVEAFDVAEQLYPKYHCRSARFFCNQLEHTTHHG